MQHRETRYDQVLYPSYTHPQTHPDRLCVIARLLGMSPAPVEKCRVLELGCGNGTNLLPMAWSLPSSSFVGVDLASRPIETGQAHARELGLSNLRLAAADLASIDSTWGEFDYIIAHGVYSWIPLPVRERLMMICRQNLAPQGVAFISYNTFPGAHLRLMLREMMLFHTRQFEDPAQKTAQAVALARLLASTGGKDEYQAWMRAEFERVVDHDEGYLFHDDLAEINDALWFTQFISHAARHSLQYLSEADFFETSDHPLSAEAREQLAQLGPNRILWEQYLDFMKCRRFRQTLLCRNQVTLRSAPDTEAVQSLFVSSAATSTDGVVDLSPGVVASFSAPKSAKVQTDFAPGKAALVCLERKWPTPVGFRELLTEADRMLNSGAETKTDAASFAPFLLQLYNAGVVDFHSWRPPLLLEPGERPSTSAVARLQARNHEYVTSLMHVPVKVEDEVGRRLLTWLDGSCDRTSLVDKLYDFLKPQQGTPASPAERDQVRKELTQKLEGNLRKLGRTGLLVDPSARL
jgi:2-polyprenyl-3-methyl-5-hydroxy-6-metoxy-1,4-benzoquinol methylase